MDRSATGNAPINGEKLEREGRGLRLRRDLRASLVDSASFGGMVGFGETYLPAFALAIGLGEMASGMISSVPLFVGGLLQLAGPSSVRWLQSNRRWVVICSVVQALMFAPLAIGALIGSMGTASILAVSSVYWGAGLAAGPAWNTWIGTIVPRAIRHRYFARRTRLAQIGVFIGFLIGGLILQFSSNLGRATEAFALLFVVAGVSRLVSAWSLHLHSEPSPCVESRRIPWRQIRHHLQSSSGGRLLIYLVLIQAAVQMSGPFFTPFMLKKLDFSYAALITLLSMAFLFKVLTLPIWGRVAKRIGATKLLWIGGIGIVPMSGGWVVSQNFAWLILLQIACGVVWAAYELAFFLLFFESIPEQERTSVLTLYNLLNTAAWVVGSLIGGAILFSFDASFHGYLLLFGLSSVGRLAALLLLARVPYLEVESDEIGLRTMAIRPAAASLDAPVLASLPDQCEVIE